MALGWVLEQVTPEPPALWEGEDTSPAASLENMAGTALALLGQ